MNIYNIEHYQAINFISQPGGVDPVNCKVLRRKGPAPISMGNVVGGNVVGSRKFDSDSCFFWQSLRSLP